MAEMQYAKSLLFAILLILVGCSDPVEDQIKQQIPVTEQRITQLATALEQGNVRNAVLLKEYANQLLANKPELKPLIDEFLKDSTTKGPMYTALEQRLSTVKTQPQMFASSQARFNELVNIYQAADPVLYSDALSDPLNVLADMSDGKLPRVNALSKDQSIAANKAQDFGIGEQLIGNPNYGSWQTDSSGMSFWAWYGVFSLMDDIFDIKRKRTYYHQWGKGRNYSYYHDYGRTRYSSPSQLNKQTQLETRTKKSFESKGQRFNSPYSKNKSGGSALSGQSRTAQTSANKFTRTSTAKSQYAKKSSSSKNASFRNSSSKTTRSFRRGK
ncbi:hypothetical protein [Thalassotalea marina]|uniref:CHAD domain-containing protein n=1 Tax=Thalassotalea marina TaxID=1673741 RepID=A0A919EIT1_9GAMM|nr:hypothetical protein [Thalassotalea marina]GHF85201.1 hypothetical protein GCM10017161_10930 [Thalassotalea marina]